MVEQSTYYSTLVSSIYTPAKHDSEGLMEYGAPSFLHRSRRTRSQVTHHTLQTHPTESRSTENTRTRDTYTWSSNWYPTPVSNAELTCKTRLGGFHGIRSSIVSPPLAACTKLRKQCSAAEICQCGWAVAGPAARIEHAVMNHLLHDIYYGTKTWFYYW